MIAITLRQILAAGACYDPRDREMLPIDHDLDAPISFREIMEKAGPKDTIWCFAHALFGHKSLKRHFAVDCAERVQHLMTDKRSLNTLTVARRHAMGDTPDAELNAAGAAAEAAAWAAGAAAWAAGAAARTAARTAAGAAEAAAEAAAWAAGAAAWAAGAAAGAAEAAARTAARTAAEAAARTWQVERIIQLTKTGKWTPITPSPPAQSDTDPEK